MCIIQKKRAGPMWQQGELSTWSDGMVPLIDSSYVGLQCKGWGYKLLNPERTFKIIGIIQEIMCIILFYQVQLNMFTWLQNTSVPGQPKASRLCWCCWRLISHRWAHRTRIGGCRLLEIGMQNPDIIRIWFRNLNNSKIISIIVIY